MRKNLSTFICWKTIKMALPINIHELLNGKTVEWDRIEFKKGWNPQEIIHSICAFANDINNWGGGYIFIGVEENNGLPILPPVGISPEKLDSIQKELLNLTHQIQPFYAPVTQPYEIDGVYILVIWIPGGDNRPYKSPTTLGEKGQKRYYIRRGSSSVLVNQKEEETLLDLAKKIPFDDRVNHHSSIDDLSFSLIREFLEEVKSDLRKEITKMTLEELAQQMRICNGPKEALLPTNAGLLFFSERPDKFFRGAVSEVVIYKDESGKEFIEKTFRGPIHHQLKQILDYFSSNVIEERVSKMNTQARSERIYNYPFEAIEEIISNAFYHRSYELENPIEINIFPGKIEVLSFPGPLPPVTQETLKQRRIIARNYRNRRIGDFFKELELTEGRASGFPTIYDSMEENGSPKPTFETDENFSYFLATLQVHSDFIEVKSVEPPESVELEGRVVEILIFCMSPKKRKEILEHIGLKSHTDNAKRYIEPLIEQELLSPTDLESIKSPNQQYITTEKGKNMIIRYPTTK